MPTFVILTGASGAGKTSIAQSIEDLGTQILVYQGDRIGLPSDEIMAGYPHTDPDEPGGPLQRAFARYWLGVIADDLNRGKSVLLDAGCRIAFLHEAMALHGISTAHIILVECADETRAVRLRERGHPELVNEQMCGWAHYLHEEAGELKCEVLETTSISLEASAAHVLRCFQT